MSSAREKGIDLLTELTGIVDAGVNLAATVEEDIRNGRPVSEAAVLALNQFKLQHLVLNGFLDDLLKELKGGSNGDH